MACRYRLPFVGLLCLAGCASWPRTKCGTSGPTMECYLLRIQVLAHQLPDNDDYKWRVLNAAADCSSDSHRSRIEEAQHCEYVLEAFLWAVSSDKYKWKKCLNSLQHRASKREPAGPPTFGPRPEAQPLTAPPLWPQYLCEEVTAFDKLEAIRVAANLPRNGADPATKARINTAIDKCESLQCILKDDPDTEYHCQWVAAAAGSAADRDWVLCAEELEHMLSN